MAILSPLILTEACSLGSLGSHALSPHTSTPLFSLPPVAFALEEEPEDCHGDVLKHKEGVPPAHFELPLEVTSGLRLRPDPLWLWRSVWLGTERLL